MTGLEKRNDILGHTLGEDFYFIDFEQMAKKYRKQKISSNDLFAKALGAQKNRDDLFVDVTCGWGEDLIYASLFFNNCLGLERNDKIYQLLEDALKRYSCSDHIQIRKLDGLSYEPDRDCVIYLDPMYPEQRKKKSLSKKHMEFLKTICGKDEDQEKLIEHFVLSPAKRVVVKRPLREGVSFPKLLTHQFKGKNIRYDIYCK